MSASPRVLRWMLAAVILAAGLLLLLFAPPMEEPAFAYRAGPGPLELKADPVTGVSRILVGVVPGTSRFERDDDACVHRFDADDGNGRELSVEVPYCFFPQAFHEASHLEVVVTGRMDGEVFLASNVEPQIGGCCGGPHCYR